MDPHWHENFLLRSRDIQNLAQSINFIDPTKIKILLQDEINSNLRKEQRNILIGQQCARDLFIILSEHQANWLDLYTMFHHVTLQTVYCPHCNHESRYKSSDLYRELSCPPDGTKLRNFVQLQFNSSESVEFFCEDGCKKKGMFKKKIQIVSKESSTFLIVVLTRGIAGSMNNYNNRVTATDDVTIHDSENESKTYSPIAVVEHEGRVTKSGNSEGHYVCDVKNEENWYKTNDESIPKLIPKNKVTKYGYVILYKRK